MIKNTIRYLLAILAKKIIKKYKPDVVGITGSVGKTSAKEAIAAVLSSKFTVRKNYKNYNNEFGVPLTVIGFEQSPGKSVLGWVKVFWRGLSLLVNRDESYPDMLVLEMGADKPGDIRYLTDIAPCKVGVLTFISHAHTQFFKTIKKIAQEKRVIISRLQKDGFAVLNFNNELVAQSAKVTNAEVVSYGFKKGTDLQASDVKIIVNEQNGRPEGLNFKALYKGNVVPVFLPGAVSKPMISSALAGLSVGIIFGVNLVEGAHALRDWRPMPGTMRLIDGIKGSLILDDTYNSSPEACAAALDGLESLDLKEGGKKYAVLGDMLELGPQTENAHRSIGFSVAERGVDYLLTVGEAMKEAAKAAKEAGMNEDRVIMFADSIQAGRFLQDKIKSEDIILVKGSRGMKMERTVKEIMAEPLEAGNLLVKS